MLLFEETVDRELEVEYKSILSENKYQELLLKVDKFTKKEKTYTQINHYFDTEDLILNKLGITLRLRLKNDKYVLQAKLPTDKEATYSESNEVSLPFLKKDAETILSKKQLFTENLVVAEVIKFVNEKTNQNSLSKDSIFILLGTLETKRTDFSFYNDTISLDHNKYNGKEDWEIEWETSNHKFVEFMNDELLKVEFDNGSGKRKRFIKNLKK